MPEFDVAAFEDLPEGVGRTVLAGDEPVMLVRRGDRVFALAALCSHEDQPLEGGTLSDGRCWECPHHGGAVDLETGLPLRMPVVAPVAAYPARVVDGRVRVAVD
jgi:3-phenylpropionate/trans-cinnamate dioxygenase ferredoxin component